MQEMKPLSAALKLQRIANQLVLEALQVERKQGDSWQKIAERVHLSRSAASGRWRRHSFSPKTQEQLRGAVERDAEYLLTKTRDLLEEMHDSKLGPEDIRNLRHRLEAAEDRLDALEEQ